MYILYCPPGYLVYNVGVPYKWLSRGTFGSKLFLTGEQLNTSQCKTVCYSWTEFTIMYQFLKKTKNKKQIERANLLGG